MVDPPFLKYYCDGGDLTSDFLWWFRLFFAYSKHHQLQWPFPSTIFNDVGLHLRPFIDSSKPPSTIGEAFQNSPLKAEDYLKIKLEQIGAVCMLQFQLHAPKRKFFCFFAMFLDFFFFFVLLAFYFFI